MAKFDKIAVLNKIGSTGMVPVFYHKDAEVAKKVVKACYDGGVRAFEFTNRGDFAQEVFAEIVKFAAKECPEMAIGISRYFRAIGSEIRCTASSSISYFLKSTYSTPSCSVRISMILS